LIPCFFHLRSEVTKRPWFYFRPAPTKTLEVGTVAFLPAAQLRDYPERNEQRVKWHQI